MEQALATPPNLHTPFAFETNVGEVRAAPAGPRPRDRGDRDRPLHASSHHWLDLDQRVISYTSVYAPVRPWCGEVGGAPGFSSRAPRQRSFAAVRRAHEATRQS